MPTNNIMFAQLSKVDVEKRLVYGRAAQEHPDKADEIMDYDSSKPNFQKWSDIAKDATSGQSLGNLRAMHGKVAAGKLVGIDFNDAEKAIDVCAKVVDDNEWKKVLEGVYTGFSIGGSYAKRWEDGAMTRYTADPSELSLVDRPCIPTATFFQVQKADGIIEQVEFQKGVDEPESLTVKGTDEEVVAFAKHLNANSLDMGTALAILQKSVAPAPKPAFHKIAFADTVNKKYPIDNEEHIRAAWNYINKAANAGKYSADELSKVRDNIIGAWKAKIDAAGPPSAEKGDNQASLAKSFIIVDDNDEPVDDTEYDSEAEAQDALDAMDDSDGLSVIEKAAASTLKKNLYTCQSLAQVVQSLNYILSSSQYEEDREGDDSDIPARLNDAVTSLGQILVDMTQEEVAELTAANKNGNDLSDIPVMQMAEAAQDLIKRAGLSKIGARNNAADQSLIQQMHDNSIALGARCGSADKSLQTDDLWKLTDDKLLELLKVDDESEQQIDIKALHNPDEWADLGADSKELLLDAQSKFGDTEELTKGDFVGHPFRGNQYGTGTSGKALHASSVAKSNGTKTNHSKAAAAHRAAAKVATKAGHSKSAEYHNIMAKFHSGMAKFDAVEAMQKLDGWADELNKAVAVATEPLNKELAKLKAAPAPAKAILRVFDKGQDIQSDLGKQIEPVLDASGQEHEPASLIKAMHKNGGTLVKF